MNKIQLHLDCGPNKNRTANRYARKNPTTLLREFLVAFPETQSREAIDEGYYDRPLQDFTLMMVTLRQGEGVKVTKQTSSPPGSTAGLVASLDQLHAADLATDGEIKQFPARLSDTAAVRIAYARELKQAARYLQYDLSVLIICDKMLTAHIYEDICKRAGKKIRLAEELLETPPTNQTPAQAFKENLKSQPIRIEDALPQLIITLQPDEVLVLRSVDMLDTPILLELLYQGGRTQYKPQLLGFLDPSLEAQKVLTDRFAVQVTMMGLPRYSDDQRQTYSVSQLMTAAEYKRFASFDAEALYKNVAGLNAIQFRNAMRYVGAIVAEQSQSKQIFETIRDFKKSSFEEIDIPDTNFSDIGGYTQVKAELRRIIALISGQVKGINERERAKLVPRGFIFHGPPGTGKTLFAKAIANEMNATIQMISGPEVMDKYVGQSESNLRKIFATARRNAPSVIFFDEFDSLASQRSTYSDGGARANNAVVAQLLTEMDGFRGDQAVLVVGTTNRLDIIDEALLRPSRLRPIEIGLPDGLARRRVAEIHAESFGLVEIMKQLCALTLSHLESWSPDVAEPPAAFLEALYQYHPPYRNNHETEQQKYRFKHDLLNLLGVIKKAQTTTIRPNTDKSIIELLNDLQGRIEALCNDHQIKVDETLNQEATDWIRPMQAGLQELAHLLRQQTAQTASFSPDSFVDQTLDLVAEYTDNFNNDEIRAIFQEASIEHHLDGQLITPRYLGMKIGILRKRRDERQTIHLEHRRGR